MGLFDRISKIAEAFVDGVADLGGAPVGIAGAVGALARVAPYGLAKDLALMPWTDDKDMDSFLEVAKRHTIGVAAEVGRNLFSADLGVGSVIKALPDQVLRKPANKVFETLETGYREGVAEPLSTAVQMNPLVALHTGKVGGGWDRIFDADEWRAAYQRAQTQSVGQSFAFRSLTVDPNDEQQRAEAEESPLFTPLSATVDGAVRLFSDPTIAAAKVASVARTRFVTKPLGEEPDFEKIVNSPRFYKFNAELEGKNASEIRDRFFPNDVNGAALSSLLADAGDPLARESVLRIAMGDRAQIKDLYATRADVAARLERLIDEQQAIRSVLDEDNFVKVNQRTSPALDPTDDDYGAMAAWDEMPSEIERTEAEIRALYDEVDRNARAESVIGAIRNEPRATYTGKLRTNITRSHFYQESRWATPVRMTFNMQPPRLLNLHDPAGDAGFTEWLRKSGMDKEAQDAWRIRYMAVGTPEGRSAVVLESENYLINTLAESAGLTRGELDRVLKEVNRGRDGANKMLQSRAYDGEGRSRLKYKDDATGEYHESPLLVSQTDNVLPLPDIEKARKVLDEIAHYKNRHGRAQEVPADLLTKFNTVWKASVLLRFGWPIRVVTDEQLRIMAKVGVMAQLANAGTGTGNIVRNRAARREALRNRPRDLKTGALIPEGVALEGVAKQRIGFGTTTIRGYEIPKVFGTDPNAPNAAVNLTRPSPRSSAWSLTPSRTPCRSTATRPRATVRSRRPRTLLSTGRLGSPRSTTRSATIPWPASSSRAARMRRPSRGCVVLPAASTPAGCPPVRVIPRTGPGGCWIRSSPTRWATPASCRRHCSAE
jgi:hypothetical protein